MKEELIELDFTVTNENWREMARYLAMTNVPWQWRQWGVRHLIPGRRYSRGPKPGVTGTGPLGKDEDDEDMWVFPTVDPNNGDLKLLLTACVGVALEATFRLHTYRFGDSIWEQVSGGPIGLTLTQ